MNLPSELFDAMMRVPPEKIRILTHAELNYFGLDANDPVFDEMTDSYNARQFGLTKQEYLKRKAQVDATCVKDTSWYACNDRIMKAP
jgi:hypothetical protein